MKQAGDDYGWLVMVLLGLGQAAMFGLWVGGGWVLGGGEGAGMGALAWWLIGTALDWLGCQVSAHVGQGHWGFQPLSGALAGWMLPVVVLGLIGLLALIGGLCGGVLRLLGGPL